MPRDFSNLSKRQQKRILVAHSKSFALTQKANTSSLKGSFSSPVEINGSGSLMPAGCDSSDSDSYNKAVNIKKRRINNFRSCDNIHLLDGDQGVSEISSGSVVTANTQTTCGVPNVPVSLFPSTQGKDTNTFSDALRKCFLQHNVSRSFVQDVLEVLRTSGGHTELPTDWRTFFKTPRTGSMNIVKLGDGDYLHFGIEANIKNFVVEYGIKETELKLNVGVDGLPLTKSSGSQFWLIVGDIVSDTSYTSPFVIGCFHSSTKPDNSNQFLSAFVNEYKMLEESGFELNGKIFTLKLNCIIADAPARAFLLCIKHHSGYFGCSKCFCEGEYVDRRVVFLETQCRLRTNDSFRLKQQPEHHHCTSILETIDIDMIKQLPLDYMHLVLLGVMKRMLILWFRGNKVIRLTKPQLEKLEEDFLSTTGYIVTEFSRKPRSLKFIDRFKATEFRLFLLYVGPVILKDILSNKAFDHFLSLVVAIRILCTNKKMYYSYAKELLLYFVKKFSRFFGRENVTYNVHNLIHLTDDVKHIGPLDTFSAFKFENKFFHIKKMLKTSRLPLQQLYNRISEQVQVNIIKKQNNVVYKKGKIFAIQFHNMTLALKFNENCCALSDGKLVLIQQFNENNGTILCLGKYYKKVENFFDTPCESQLVGMYKVSNCNLSTEQIEFRLNDIVTKCQRIKSGESFVIITLLHVNAM